MILNNRRFLEVNEDDLATVAYYSPAESTLRCNIYVISRKGNHLRVYDGPQYA